MANSKTKKRQRAKKIAQKAKRRRENRQDAKYIKKIDNIKKEYDLYPEVNDFVSANFPMKEDSKFGNVYRQLQHVVNNVAQNGPFHYSIAIRGTSPTIEERDYGPYNPRELVGNDYAIQHDIFNVSIDSKTLLTRREIRLKIVDIMEEAEDNWNEYYLTFNGDPDNYDIVVTDSHGVQTTMQLPMLGSKTAFIDPKYVDYGNNTSFGCVAEAWCAHYSKEIQGGRKMPAWVTPKKFLEVIVLGKHPELKDNQEGINAEIEKLSKQGVAMQDLYYVHAKFRRNIYMVNTDLKLWDKWVVQGKNHEKTFPFVICNNHLYVIRDETLVTKITNHGGSYDKGKKGKKKTITCVKEFDSIDTQKFLDFAETVKEPAYIAISCRDLNPLLEGITKTKRNGKYMLCKQFKYNCSPELLTRFEYYNTKNVRMLVCAHPNIHILPTCKILGVQYNGQNFASLVWSEFEKFNGGQLEQSWFSPKMQEEIRTYRKNATVFQTLSKIELEEKRKNGLLAIYDIVKCYSASMYYNTAPFLVFSGHHDPVLFKGKITDDKLYLCISENIDKLIVDEHGKFLSCYDPNKTFVNGWYTSTWINEMNKHGAKIVPVVECQAESKLKPELFKQFIDYLIAQGVKGKALKHMNNYLVGMLRRMKEKKLTGLLTESYQQCAVMLSQTTARKHIPHIREFTKLDSSPLYLFTEKSEEELFENNIPILIQIMDNADLLVRDLVRVVLKSTTPDKIYAISTDSITFEGKAEQYDTVDVATSTKDVVKYWGTPHNEDINKKKFHDTPFSTLKQYGWVQGNAYDEQKWEDVTLPGLQAHKDSKEYKDAVHSLSQRSVLIRAPNLAGAGKTTLVNALKVDYKKPSLGIAPSNLAAIGIEGKTAHCGLEVSIDRTPRSRERVVKNLIKNNILNIRADEIDMLESFMWREMLYIKQKIPEMQFQLAGAKDQLPPVNEEGLRIDYDESPTVRALCDNRKIELTHSFRSDPQMVQLLNYVKQTGKIPTFLKPSKDLTFFSLAYTNKFCWNEVHKQMEYDKEDFDHRIIHREICDTEQQEDFVIRVGSPLYARHGVTGQFVKNQIGEIKAFDEKTITVKMDSAKEFTFNDKEFLKLFLSRYCITVHKAQGMTIRNNIRIHEILKFTLELLYVALSRVQHMDQIHIEEIDYDHVFLPSKWKSCVDIGFTAQIYDITIGNMHYIGSTRQTLEDRLKQHLNDKSNPEFHDLLRKSKYTMKTIREQYVLSEDHLHTIEQIEINKKNQNKVVLLNAIKAKRGVE
mgnify:CR=1 FL=1